MPTPLAEQPASNNKNVSAKVYTFFKSPCFNYIHICCYAELPIGNENMKSVFFCGKFSFPSFVLIHKRHAQRSTTHFRSTYCSTMSTHEFPNEKLREKLKENNYFHFTNCFRQFIQQVKEKNGKKNRNERERERNNNKNRKRTRQAYGLTKIESKHFKIRRLRQKINKKRWN